MLQTVRRTVSVIPERETARKIRAAERRFITRKTPEKARSRAQKSFLGGFKAPRTVRTIPPI